jgi:hypothetical protein
MFDTMTVGEFDGEEDLIWECTRNASDGVWEPVAPAFPADLDIWTPDLRLAAVLSAVDVDRLSRADRVAYLKAQERLNAAGAAASLRALSAIADVYDELAENIEDPGGGASSEVRSALRWTRRTAESEMAFAHHLRIRLPRLFESLSAGLVDRRRAALLVRHTDHLPVAHARMGVDARLTTGQLIEQIRRVCIDIDPDAARRAVMSRREPTVGWSAGRSRMGP